MEHVTTMVEEAQKSRPDMELLEEMMHRTRAYRRTCITFSSTRDIIKEFPCLKMQRLVFFCFCFIYSYANLDLLLLKVTCYC